ncbi:MAG: hypothetical protein A2005_08960 [Desulfuromonadales bacterium GWC2_61_20]|nr:MAG: hypothetical protein A2005_08960 [Desulfuromonadales bacterium GWC2_61_20]
MKLSPLVLLTWLFLLGAAPPTVMVTPDPPRLGVPLSITFTLADAETTLAGLPDLGSLALLLPPQRVGHELRLLLMPLRGGEVTLPSLPLLHGSATQSATPLITFKVIDDLATDATLAPIRKRSTPAPMQSWPDFLYAGIGGLLLVSGAIWLRWRQTLQQSPAPEGDALLARWQQQLAPHLATSSQARELYTEIERRRFAPPAADTAATLEQLRAAMTAVLGGTP